MKMNDKCDKTKANKSLEYIHEFWSSRQINSVNFIGIFKTEWKHANGFMTLNGELSVFEDNHEEIANEILNEQ